MKHVEASNFCVMFMCEKHKLHAGRNDLLVFRVGQVSKLSDLVGGYKSCEEGQWTQNVQNLWDTSTFGRAPKIWKKLTKPTQQRCWNQLQ